MSGGLGLEEIQRLGDRGVPVLDILEEKLGLTRQEISEFGKTAEGARKITEAFAQGINERFGGATQNLIANTSTKFSNLGIALKNAADDIGEQLAPAIGDATVALTEFIEENEEAIISVAEFVGGALSAFLNILGKVAAAVFKVVGAVAKLGNRIKELLGFTKEEVKVEEEKTKKLQESTKAYEKSTRAIKTNKESTKKLIEDNKKLNEQYNFNVSAQELLKNGINTLNDAMVTGFSDAILKAKTLGEAIRNIANVALRQLIEGFVQIALVTPILERLTKFLRQQGILQDNLNSKLRTEIGLRSILALFGGGGGGGFGIPFLADGGKTVGGRPYIVGERGPELFVPSTAGTVVPNDQLGMGTSGPVNVNFNINAVDAASFDELLLSRKNLIVGTIQQAFRQQGRRLA